MKQLNKTNDYATWNKEKRTITISLSDKEWKFAEDNKFKIKWTLQLEKGGKLYETIE